MIVVSISDENLFPLQLETSFKTLLQYQYIPVSIGIYKSHYKKVFLSIVYITY